MSDWKKLPHGIELLEAVRPRQRHQLHCINCDARADLKDRSRFLKRHPMVCVRAILERRRFSKQLAQGVRSVEDTERRGGRYGTVN